MAENSVVNTDPSADPANHSPANLPWAWFPPVIPSDPPAGAQPFKVSLGDNLSIFDYTKIMIAGVGIALIGGIIYVTFARR